MFQHDSWWTGKVFLYLVKKSLLVSAIIQVCHIPFSSVCASVFSPPSWELVWVELFLCSGRFSGSSCSPLSSSTLQFIKKWSYHHLVPDRCVTDSFISCHLPGSLLMLTLFSGLNKYSPCLSGTPSPAANPDTDLALTKCHSPNSENLPRVTYLMSAVLSVLQIPPYKEPLSVFWRIWELHTSLKWFMLKLSHIVSRLIFQIKWLQINKVLCNSITKQIKQSHIKSK